ncbi:hypothetical protein [Streptomyces sp. NPDC059701]|uniref:hypothetical protein n=1 Tax=Streptomyces sp. NPDC059701 TaxID=3346914 RepID=UPI0036CA2CC8
MTLERQAVEAHARYTAPGVDDLDAARAAWLKAAEAVQAAITEHAAADEGTSRYEVEMAVKKAVRHPEGEAD